MHKLLEIAGLCVRSAEGQLLGPVSFGLQAGQALTLLGESGSGKSLLAQAVMGTLPHRLRASGRIALAGKSFNADDASARRPMWGRQLALLPQEPWLALDPTMRVGSQLAEVHGLVHGQSRVEPVARRSKSCARLAWLMPPTPGPACFQVAWPSAPPSR
ncbi:ATP-binding cassette domain-containing protein [Cupriavidus sp. KK10]|uniref:ATP-binding cassette domain-containing protein n=1 Tax=Cupriavidus sp. KK10 TaxID=1478019 RepID=UPI00353023A1